MKVWPFGAALRGEASNHQVVRRLRPFVLSDLEKAHMRCQVGTRKTIAVDASLLNEVASKPGRLFGSGMSLAGARVLARWCPAWRQREPGLRLSYGTWEGGPRYRCPCCTGQAATGSAPSGRNRKGLSTVAGFAGGPACSSGEALVMRVERRGRIICGLFAWSTERCSGGTT